MLKHTHLQNTRWVQLIKVLFEQLLFLFQRFCDNVFAVKLPRL